MIGRYLSGSKSIIELLPIAMVVKPCLILFPFLIISFKDFFFIVAGRFLTLPVLIEAVNDSASDYYS